MKIALNFNTELLFIVVIIILSFVRLKMFYIYHNTFYIQLKYFTTVYIRIQFI